MADDQATDTQTSLSEPPATVTAGPQRPKEPNTKQIAVAVAVLGAGILVTALTSGVAHISEPGVRLVDGQLFLPDKAADWTGGPLQGLSEIESNSLPPDTEGARRLYTDKTGNQVFCSIILAGREVASIHRPELCLPGQGWTMENREHTERIPTSGASGGQLEVMRMNMTHPMYAADGRAMMARYVFVYWFVGKGRVTPYHWQRILWTSMDRVLHNTNHRWAYVLIHAPVGQGRTGVALDQSEDETMRLVARFVQDIYPALVSN